MAKAQAFWCSFWYDVTGVAPLNRGVNGSGSLSAVVEGRA